MSMLAFLFFLLVTGAGCCCLLWLFVVSCCGWFLLLYFCDKTFFFFNSVKMCTNYIYNTVMSGQGPELVSDNQFSFTLA